MPANEYPAPACMMCGRECDVSEETYIGWANPVFVTYSGGPMWELWCYCRECDVETFHPAINLPSLGYSPPVAPLAGPGK